MKQYTVINQATNYNFLIKSSDRPMINEVIVNNSIKYQIINVFHLETREVVFFTKIINSIK